MLTFCAQGLRQMEVLPSLPPRFKGHAGPQHSATRPPRNSTEEGLYELSLEETHHFSPQIPLIRTRARPHTDAKGLGDVAGLLSAHHDSVLQKDLNESWWTYDCPHLSGW